jgi:hypothetical protein
MAVKVNITELDDNDISYPRLMIYKNGNVVLFNSLNRGTLLKKSPSSTFDLEVGDYSESWVGSEFTPLTGSITLSNE